MVLYVDMLNNTQYLLRTAVEHHRVLLFMYCRADVEHHMVLDVELLLLTVDVVRAAVEHHIVVRAAVVDC